MLLNGLISSCLECLNCICCLTLADLFFKFRPGGDIDSLTRQCNLGAPITVNFSNQFHFGKEEGVLPHFAGSYISVVISDY